MYIEKNDVRDITGADEDIATDDELDRLISKVEGYTEQWLNSKFTPTEDIAIIDGENKNQFVIDHNPLLKINELIVSDSSTDTTMDLDNISFYKESGLVKLDLNASRAIFPSYNQNIKCNYIYGWVEYSNVNTTISAAITAGEDKDLLTSSTSGFEVDDWVEIYGMDGNREVAQITEIVENTSITIDSLIYSHQSSSRVVLLKTPELVKQFMIVEAGISVAVKALGGTYKFNASYSLDEFGVVKGVPYTHWREVVLKLVDKRKTLVGDVNNAGLLRPRPYIA